MGGKQLSRCCVKFCRYRLDLADAIPRKRASTRHHWIPFGAAIVAVGFLEHIRCLCCCAFTFSPLRRAHFVLAKWAKTARASRRSPFGSQLH